MSKGIDSERKSLGLEVRNTSDPMSNVTGDEQNFKFALITPREPMGVADFDSIGDDGELFTQKRNVPLLVSTMALGNLTVREVALARIFTEMSRLCSWHGYFKIAIDYYLKVVHLNVTSQSHQSQLLRQILTETVSVSRKEESLSGTRDYTNEGRGGGLSGLFSKIQSKDAQAQQGQPGQPAPQTNNFGLR